MSTSKGDEPQRPETAAPENPDAFDTEGRDVRAALGRIGSSRGSRRSLSRSFTGAGGSLSRRSGIVSLAAVNVFRTSGSRTENEFDDEEALKWAALERLPTYDRLRTTILEDIGNGSKEPVDLRSLSQTRLRNELLTKLFNETGEDNSNATFLLRLRERVDK